MAWVWPLPQKMEVGNDILRLDDSFWIHYNAPYETHAIIRKAIHRYKKLIFNKGEFGDQLDTVNATVFPAGKTSIPELPPQPMGWYPSMNRLVINVEDSSLRLQMDTDESYTLDVPAEGDSVITAKTVFGALRGLESFSQLVKWHSSTDQFRIPLAPVHITDYPKFSHRGILIDTSRNYLTPKAIKRTLDAMSYNKLNVLHWHIIDSHSFPLKSWMYPELARAAYNKDWVYDENTIRDIVSYAKDRGIRVMPEYDIPGHSYSWGIAMPEIVSCMNRQPDWSDFAAEPPSGQLNLINPRTLEVVRNLLQETTKWFEEELFHIGGDEVNMKCWETSPGYPEYLKEHNTTLDALFADFIHKDHSYVRENKKVPVTWQGALLTQNVTMEDDVIVQTWLGNAASVAAVRLGHRVIASSYEHSYLDCGHGAWIASSLGNSWCDPYKSWQVIYSYEMTANMTEAEAKLVIGGETAMWGEQVDSINFDARVWPRASSSAEVLWSGNTLANGTLRPTADVSPRINEMRARLVDRGIGAAALQPLWCQRFPGMC
ncbi:hypothetical protein K493DRAFT_242670 [Basidiobolus meristosporus CBS 931.73]|uniref:Beta-hexosaminidase n=1 Tax=Basidiobolus meristosporus CBS 931.73 TaxID=1314790 RepID=A0A1Y1X3T6_9FUNG|nr:hypothetical protein K493DRAFT_242670 [Basidiobolus meristosporus CBS 931.73]|eukprot:ORX80469.1 hypothetical protein K493DRAFT_242670 [Basidiobolus meristosporus CBS 931.73]